MAHLIIVIAIALQPLVWLRAYRRTDQRKGYALALLLSIVAVALAGLGRTEAAMLVLNAGYTVTCLLCLARLRWEFRQDTPSGQTLWRLLRSHNRHQWGRVAVVATLMLAFGIFAFQDGNLYGPIEAVYAIVIALGFVWAYWASDAPETAA